jgi:hypothetical protein
MADGETGAGVLHKPCVAPGCSGTMYFQERLAVAQAPHTLEWPWHATWVCAENSAHFQIISESERREIRRSRIEMVSRRLLDE